MTTRGQNFTFIHIPKTGGTTVLSVLSAAFTLVEGTGKKHGKYIDGDIGPGLVFAFVRNPWDRMLSFWAMTERGRVKRESMGLFDHKPEHGTSFHEYVDNVYTGVLSRPMMNCQVDWLVDSAGNIGVSRICQFENFEKELEAIMLELGAPVGTYQIPRLNPSAHDSYRDVYTAKDQRKVAKVYAKDIDEFKYNF